MNSASKGYRVGRTAGVRWAARAQVCLLIPCLSFVLSSASGCRRSVEQAASSPQQPRVTVTYPKPLTVAETINVVGHVGPSEEAILYSKVAGYLETISVDLGDWVEKGQLLARVDDPETRLELEEGRADARAKKAVFERLSSAFEKAPDLIRPLDVDRARGEFEAAQADMDRLERRVAFAEIRAPFHGIVTDRWVDPGALIPMSTTSQSPAARLMRVARVDTVRVRVQIPESRVAELRLGHAALVRVPAISKEQWCGFVARFARSLDPFTRTMETEIDVPNADHRIYPGMYATVLIETDAQPALEVPSEVLVVEGISRFVWTLAGDTARRVSVKVLSDDGASIRLTGELQASTAVILARPDGLKDGMVVRAVESSRP